MSSFCKRGHAAGLLAALLFTGTLAAQSAAPRPAGVPVTSVPTPAAAPAPAIDPAEVERRVKALSHELRCLVCQNQTLADSRADLAGDLLAQVTEQVAAGKTDDEVKAYLVARYGDFVLYRPPLQSNTAALWIGPFALLIVGGVVFYFVQRRQRSRGAALAAGNATGTAADVPETDADLERAKKLLG